LLSETAVSPPVSDGLSGSAVIRDINHLLRETVIPETQVAQEMQHDVVDDTQDGSRSNSFDDDLDNLVEEAAQQQQQADLALFDDEEDDVFFDHIDNNDDNDQSGALVSSTIAPADWGDASPQVVLAKLKQIKPEVYERFGLRAFDKSYNSWEKMTGEQRNKAVAWYRKLSPEIQGRVF
jgi:hypothetical protein